MLPLRIEGATHHLFAPAGWSEDDPPCDALWVRSETVDGVPVLTSAWEPTPDEIAAIVAGAPIRLSLVCTAHPPVAILVGPAPEV